MKAAEATMETMENFMIYVLEVVDVEACGLKNATCRPDFISSFKLKIPFHSASP